MDADGERKKMRLVMVSLVGACAAFLRYNFHPARIFLGDSGSLFLGFAMAAVPLSTNSKSVLLTALLVPLLAVGVPLFDTLLAIWRRTARRALRNPGVGEADAGGLMQADLDHLHHRLARRGLSQRSVAACLYAAASAVLAVGLLAASLRSYSTGILTIATVVLVYVVVRHVAHVELWDSAQAIARGLGRPPRTVSVVLLYPLADLALLAGGFLAALRLGAAVEPGADAIRVWFRHAPLAVGVPFVLLAGAGVYRRVWGRAGVAEYIVLGLTAAGGALVGAAADSLAGGWDTDALIRSGAIYSGLALLSLTLLRLFPRAVHETICTMLRRGGGEGAARVLVLGAGFAGTAYLRARCRTLHDGALGEMVVGFVDDDPNLQGRTVYGRRILGGTESLGPIVDAERATVIIVTEPLDALQRQRLAAVAASRAVPVFTWGFERKPWDPAAGVPLETAQP